MSDISGPAIANPPPPSVIVAIPTFRRPERLRYLLEALNRQSTNRRIGILVADNDADKRQGQMVVNRLVPGTFRFPIHAIVVERRGLASIRNALLAEALQSPSVRHVAMIDDDEWPDPDWIESLVSMQEQTAADIVGGPVYAAFETRTSASLAACRLFRPYKNPGGPIDIVWATNNVLLTRACLDGTRNDWFDECYGLSGGEDTDYFVRQRMRGRRFAWAPAAIVHESIPSSRTRYLWVLRRAFRIGTTNANIQRRRGFRGRTTASVVTIAAAKLVTALAGLPIRALLVRGRADALCDLAEAGGMLLGSFGYRFDEYSK